MIRLSRESMEAAFIKYLETVFEHPENAHSRPVFMTVTVTLICL